MKRSLIYGSAAALISLLSGASYSQESPSPRVHPGVGLVKQFGPGLIRNLSAETAVTFEPSRLSPPARSAAGEKMLKDYGKVRSEYAGLAQASSWLSWESGAAAAVGAAMFPAIAGGTLVVGALGAIYFEVEREKIAAEGIERGRAVLAAHKDQIISELGMTYDELSEGLRAGNTEMLSRFRSAVGNVQDLRQRAEGDPDVLEATSDLLADVASNVDEAVLEQMLTNTADLRGHELALTALGRTVAAIEKDVDERVGQVEEAVEDLSVAVGELNESVTDLNGRMSALEGDQSVIADFVFSSMSPAEKVSALETTGFLKERFSCPEGVESCKASELRTSMINKFKREAQIQSLASGAARAAGTVSDIQAIAVNLGVDLPPELGEAAKVTNAAAGALANIAAGNPLGAVAAITSVFGQHRDPADVRHEALMGYLGQRFDRIDAKLDQLAHGQLELMTAVHSVSVQIQEGFKEINNSLARLEFEQKRISQGLRLLIWDPWKTCSGVFVLATEEEDGIPMHMDPNTLLFLDETSLRDLIDVNGVHLVQPCLTVMKSNLLNLFNTDRFGSFIDLEWVMNERLEETNTPGLPPVNTAEAKEWRSRLETYLGSVFTPAQSRAQRFTNNTFSGATSQTFAILARPIMTTDDWRMALQSASDRPFACNDNTAPDARLYPLLCPGSAAGGTADTRAQDLLSDAVQADAALDIAKWALVMAPLADISHGNEWVYPSDWVERIEAGQIPPQESGGKQIIERMIFVLDKAIASYGMIYGPLPAANALAQLKVIQAAVSAESRAGAKASEDAGRAMDLFLADLAANDYLARNMVQLLLEERFSKWEPGSFRPYLKPYTDAYLAAENDRADRYSYLQTVYGKDLTFGMSDGRLSVIFSSTNRKLAVPIPTPWAMVEGRLLMPSQYHELIAMRDRLVDRLYGYNIVDGLSADEQIVGARALLR